MKILPGDTKETRIKSLVQQCAAANRLFDLMKGIHDLYLERQMPVPDQLKEIVDCWQSWNSTYHRNLRHAFDCDYVYTILGSGEVSVETHVLPGEGLPFLPRIGLQLHLPDGI